MITTLTILLWLATANPVAGATDAASTTVSAGQSTGERLDQEGGCPASTELKLPVWRTRNTHHLPAGKRRLHDAHDFVDRFRAWMTLIAGSGGPVCPVGRREACVPPAEIATSS